MGKNYHHGNLRDTLVAQATRILERDGPSAVSIRAVARAAGVSHAAPYHHFRDKDALLAAVAKAGFTALELAVRRRVERLDSPTPARVFQEAGIAYVVFAVDRTGLFRLMFGSEFWDTSAHPELHAAARSAFGIIQQGVAATAADGADQELGAIASWSLVHGLAMLLIDGQLGEHAKTSVAAEALTRRLTDPSRE